MILTYCKECLMPHTRPRQQFNGDGVCSACEWNKEKKVYKYLDEAIKSFEKVLSNSYDYRTSSIASLKLALIAMQKGNWQTGKMLLLKL